MKLSDNGLQDKAFWASRGFCLPRFDRDAVRERTNNAPSWLHFGAGNIFRAFIAMLAQQLINEGYTDKGIIAAEGYDFDIIDTVYKPFDDLSVLVTLVPDGSVKKTVIGSITDSVKTDAAGTSALRDIFTKQSLQMVSFTITEKGYDIVRADGTFHPPIEADMTAGPKCAQSFLGLLTALCLHRYQNGAYPLTLVSMDNCSGNGNLLHNAVNTIACKWCDNGFADHGFIDYIQNPSMLSFPCTMIDKITPYPDGNVADILTRDGLDNMKSIMTAKKTVTAAFVNAEEPEYLVIEDVFPAGRPPLEKTGVLFTDRETVDKVEKMKVGTCLNPLHTALSVFGCMLGYTKISDTMRDPHLRKLVDCVAEEGLPVVTDPKIISPQEFIDTVINIRLPNPYIPDTPQRIATDTSRKLAARFGETVRSYIKRDDLDVLSLRAIPMVLAGWCRYLMGLDDNLEKFELSPDPLRSELCLQQDELCPFTYDKAEEILRPILSNCDIFGLNLYDAGIAENVIKYFIMMTNGRGAVRECLCTLKTK